MLPPNISGICIFDSFQCNKNLRKSCFHLLKKLKKYEFLKLCSKNYCSLGTLGTMPDKYEPSTVEKKMYDYRIKESVCQPKKVADNSTSTTFSLLLPPPNVTGTLHLGHSLTVTVQDILARWNRMCGKNVLWIPGQDHAGIATQTTFEKVVWKEMGLTRHKLGREKFHGKMWVWQNEKGKIINEQLKKMGATLDWSREYFTLDENHSEAVNKAFVRLHDDGLIYRSSGIVNWSCKLESAISDIEVDHVDVEKPTFFSVPGYESPVEFGVLNEFAYRAVDSENELIVSTTRLETMLGDTAIAIHPSDERYIHWHGAHVWHPIRNEAIPVVCDETVDPNFGTGVVKVTPAHSQIDYEIAKRNNLDCVSIINEDGTMNDLCGIYKGLQRFDVRKNLKDHLSALGLYRNQKSHAMSVPVCSRTGDVVEFLLKPQWFLSCKKMSEVALNAVETGDLEIVPSSYKNVWVTWLSNIRDWCLSRQLWWGHRIPVYECCINGESDVVWVAAENYMKAQEKAAFIFKLNTSDINKIKLKQDDDVLDTWFSSALLPFAVHGWPRETHDFKEFYPLSMMETGHDILFFWVARMVMLGYYLTGKLPFKKVLLHGMICDSHGRKMSKSLGNAIDPQDIIYGASSEALSQKAHKSYESGLISFEELNKTLESNKIMFPNGIPECGSDALRFSLCSQNITNVTVHFDVNQCYSNRLFINKIWQACRYIEGCYKDVLSTGQSAEKIPLGKLDEWIMSRLSYLVLTVNESLASDSFHIAADALKKFIRDEFCSIYLEATKPVVKAHNLSSVKTVETLMFCMHHSLLTLCPFMPYFTEYLYQHLASLQNLEVYNGITYASFPSVQEFSLYRNECLEKEVSIVLDIISTIRNLKGEHKITKKDKPVGFIVPSVNNDYLKCKEYESMICTLCGISGVQILNKVPENVGINSAFKSINGIDIYLEVNEKKVKTKIKMPNPEKYNAIKKDLLKLQKMTSHPSYRSSAPSHVQEAHMEKMAKLEAELKELQNLDEVMRQ